MGMKVYSLNQIVLNNSIDKKEVLKPKTQSISNLELENITPDFAITTPQKYTKLGETEFANGLKLHSYKLANGYRVSIIPMEGASATVKNYVNVGALNEADNIKGISHFLEHMAFNGTTGKNGYIKLHTGDSFKKIDKLGGWTNASTSYAITDYVNSTPLLEEKDLEEQIKIIAAMTEDLALTQEMIEKEKGPVCSEINMILDDPETISMDQTVRTLFNIKSSADELIAGSTKHIQKLTRKDVLEYYNKYYTPDNMNLVITGDINPNKIIEIVSKNFHSNKKNTHSKNQEKLLPITTSIRKDIISNKATSANISIGFAGPQNNDSKSLIIQEILEIYIAKSNIGINKEFKDINADSYFGREKISNNPNNPSLIYYNIECSEENSEKALKIIYDKLSTLKAPSQEEFENLKEYILQEYQNGCEHSYSINNIIGNAILDNNLEYALNYKELLNSITIDDIQKYIDRYINLDKSAITVVHPQTTIEELANNYQNASKLSFKRSPKPINTQKIEEKTLNNNIKAVFYESNNDNIKFYINYKFPPNLEINPATRRILSEILSMGTTKQSEDEFNQYLDDNNIDLYTDITPYSFCVSGFSNFNNHEKAFNITKELINSPRINQESLDKAVAKIKDSLTRTPDNVYSLYFDHESKTNPLRTSKALLIKELDKVTVEDLKTLHQYILNNSSASILMNTPKNKDVKDKAISSIETLKNVKDYDKNLFDIYKENKKALVLTKDRNIVQAEILETFSFETENTPKEEALFSIMNNIMNTSSIGLFTVLREKEHLAYNVNSDYWKNGNKGNFSCFIMTTTDNKENNEISYDNVKKSINGFNRQINEMLNSKYTDEDLENAKKALKAKLLIKETTDENLGAINYGLFNSYNIEYNNLIYNEIDKITREDLQEYAKKVFKNPPIYTIVASKDTLDANKEFFETLESA